jgi:transcriptional regulator with PAS, ATPase and Fis domain
MQVKLLRVLQTGEVHRIGSDKVLKVDTRIIASTNINLTNAIAQNRFRKDLYYRLNILQITIPPLRERGADDINALAQYFVAKNKPDCRLTPASIEALTSYTWPGNARELENTIQRALHICDSNTLEVKHLGLPNRNGLQKTPPIGSLQEMEQKMISTTLIQTKNNMAKTAKKLGISRATLYRKVKQYNISTVFETQ